MEDFLLRHININASKFILLQRDWDTLCRLINAYYTILTVDNAPGSPSIASSVQRLLGSAGIPAKVDGRRGLDHGVFVPLMLMFPAANIPVVSLSLHTSLDPEMHIRIGEALAPLRDQGILIIGSGASFHNFDYFFARDLKTKTAGIRHSHSFNSFLTEALTAENLTAEDRRERLVRWASAPSARDCHKVGQEEHLIPLMVIFGAGGGVRGSIVGRKPAADAIAIANIEFK
jgi:aromatic ring-opening dioxygenase catalytic subunit (LigB family)